VIALAEKKPKNKESSIIEIIQEMVADGESEDKILGTLRDLGVPIEKAKRLLLVGQADTFALLRSEISKIVKSDLDLEKPRLTKYISEEAARATEGVRGKLEKQLIGDLQKYEKEITGQSQTFQEQSTENVKKIGELSERVRSQLNALGSQVDTVQKDMDEMKIRGVGTRSRFLSAVFIVMGISFCMLTGYFAVTYMPLFQTTGVTIDSIITMLAVGLIGITMLFVATLF